MSIQGKSVELETYTLFSKESIAQNPCRRKVCILGPYYVEGIVWKAEIQDWHEGHSEFGFMIDGIFYSGISSQGVLLMKDVYLYRPDERKNLYQRLQLENENMENVSDLRPHMAKHFHWGIENDVMRDEIGDDKIEECINFSTVNSLNIYFTDGHVGNDLTLKYHTYSSTNTSPISVFI